MREDRREEGNGKRVEGEREKVNNKLHTVYYIHVSNTCNYMYRIYIEGYVSIHVYPQHVFLLTHLSPQPAALITLYTTKEQTQLQVRSHDQSADLASPFWAMSQWEWPG